MVVVAIDDKILGLNRAQEASHSVSNSVYECYSTENVVSIHSNSTAQSDYKALVASGAADALLRFEPLKFCLCSGTHTQSNTQTPPKKKNETSKRLT